ncbi:kinase-like domain-containing protein [Halteromyces radiatus]|uniref:kinase-like domain-containing protein n=1 Tax=Halteromyces radiatus TaxID=101107 RepID=UPI00221FA354|nr:kinase-like domain-containing protein [Halteromyces radiatus]KAI8088671.1 kinase-like domain-containing protein [Halteromyces radiatus]
MLSRSKADVIRRYNKLIFTTQPNSIHSYHRNDSMCSVIDTLKGLWGKKSEINISPPYNATHVNHVHFDINSNEWRWDGCYPELMETLTSDQQEILILFIRQLYNELKMTWNTTLKQYNGIDSCPSTHEQTVLRIKQACKMDDPALSYQSWSRIGEGASGIVYKAHDQEGIAVAVKRIRLNQHPRHDLLWNEINVAKSSKCHPNIVQYISSYLWLDDIWMVMEYMDGGSLTDIVTYRYLFENEISVVCREVLQGLDYLHSNQIIHRDIKSDNILVSRQGHIKLSDFGFCARLSHHQPQRKTLAGTICWMAPEIVSSEPYGCKVDIWSFGITVIEMIESKPPYFSNPGRATTMLKLKQQPTLLYPQRLSSTLRHFLQQCFVLEPQQRSSAAILLQHPFVTRGESTDVLLPLIHSSLGHP